MNQQADPGIITGTGRGATISTTYTERQVNAYAVFESELESISLFNTMALAFFSVSSALVSFAIGIWTNAAFAEKMTPEGVLATKYLAPAFCVLALIGFVIGMVSISKRRGEWQKIKGQSKAHTRVG